MSDPMDPTLPPDEPPLDDPHNPDDPHAPQQPGPLTTPAFPHQSRRIPPR